MRTELEGEDTSWTLLTSSSMVVRDDTDIHPRLYTSTIIKVAEDCIWFHGKADWDDEAKSGIFTMTFDHQVTFKIIVRPSLEIVIADFYRGESNKMVILTHEKRPKPRLFEVTKHNYELMLHNLATGIQQEESALNIDLLGVKGVFLHHDELHFICVKVTEIIIVRNILIDLVSGCKACAVATRAGDNLKDVQHRDEEVAGESDHLPHQRQHPLLQGLWHP